MRRAPRNAAARWLGALLLGSACSPDPGPPDLLLISLDSVRADMLTFLDPEATPRLAELARRGVVFTQAVSGTSWTLPSHVQMFTGQPPVLHGVQWGSVRVDPLTPTLSECLQAAGYFTAGYWTGWFLAGSYGFDRGFDVYANAMNLGLEQDARLRQALAREDRQQAQQVLRTRNRSSHADVTSPDVVRRVGDQLGQLAAEHPLFLFCHFMDPHYDYVPPEPFDRRFDPDYEGALDGADYWSNRRIWDPSRKRHRQVSQRDLEHLVSLYRGEIAWTDQAIGRILDHLKAEGRLERTLIVVTADHGEEFFEHGGRGHRQGLMEEVLRVPLLIVPPGASASGPRLCARQASLSDLMPTLLDYAGVVVPEGVYGRSLRPLLEGRDLPPRPLVGSLVSRPGEGTGGQGFRLLESLRTPDSKLVRRVVLGADGRSQVQDLFWFDLRADPGEQRPVRDASDPRVRAAHDRLEQELAAIRRVWRERPRSPLDSRRTGLAALVAEELQALGYAGQADPDRPEEHWALEPQPPLALPDPSPR